MLSLPEGSHLLSSALCCNHRKRKEENDGSKEHLLQNGQRRELGESAVTAFCSKAFHKIKFLASVYYISKNSKRGRMYAGVSKKKQVQNM